MKITFVAGSKEAQTAVSAPESARNYIPKWYKDIPANNDDPNVKKCMPFLDAMSSGYIQTTWSDIEVSRSGDEVTVLDKGNFSRFNNTFSPQMFYFRNKSEVTIGDEYYKIEFLWKRQWAVSLPEGYSALVTHPLNRTDLPFTTFSGIIDCDNYSHVEIGNIPFFLKSHFLGIIPAGTPMFQIIPIKREDWVLEKQDYSEEYWKQKKKELESDSGYYKKQFWNRKKFD